MIIYAKGYFYLSMALSISVSYLLLHFAPHYYYAGYQAHGYDPDFTIRKEYVANIMKGLRDYTARLFG